MTVDKSDSEKTTFTTALFLSETSYFIKSYWIKIGLTCLVFGAAGYGLSFLTPETFKSTASIIPESNSSGGMGSLSSLARLTGIGKPEGGGAIPPDLYPAILATVPFGQHLLQQAVIDQHNRSYKTLKDYLHANTTRRPSGAETKKITRNGLESTKIISLSKAEEQDVRMALRLVDSSFDQKSGILSVESTASDPYIAAQMVDITSKYLIQYISDYRGEKTSREVTFLSERLNELKKRQQVAEYALQNYKDRNRNSFLNVARIEEQRLQADYILAQSLYSEIIRKWEEAKIRAQEQQPVIKVLSPPQIPLKRFKPIRRNIALGFAIVGALIAAAYYAFFVEKYYKRLYAPA